MKLIKYEHACTVIEERDQTLVIDPGSYSYSFPPEALEHVTAAVITHAHPDHFDLNHLRILFAHNPSLVIFAPADVVDPTGELPINHVVDGQSVRAGVFSLAFHDAPHESIQKGIPLPRNIAVTVNETVYYPGDSFTRPAAPVPVVLTPIAAPWTDVSRAAKFLDAAPGGVFIPTHDAILSKDGQQLYDRLLAPVAERKNSRYIRLATGESYVHSASEAA